MVGISSPFMYSMKRSFISCIYLGIPLFIGSDGIPPEHDALLFYKKFTALFKEVSKHCTTNMYADDTHV